MSESLGPGRPLLRAATSGYVRLDPASTKREPIEMYTAVGSDVPEPEDDVGRVFAALQPDCDKPFGFAIKTTKHEPPAAQHATVDAQTPENASDSSGNDEDIGDWSLGRSFRTDAGQPGPDSNACTTIEPPQANSANRDQMMACLDVRQGADALRKKGREKEGESEFAQQTFDWSKFQRIGLMPGERDWVRRAELSDSIPGHGKQRPIALRSQTRSESLYGIGIMLDLVEGGPAIVRKVPGEE